MSHKTKRFWGVGGQSEKPLRDFRNDLFCGEIVDQETKNRPKLFFIAIYKNKRFDTIKRVIYRDQTP
jgi:hypothetical protein